MTFPQVAYHRLLHLPYIPTLLETIKSLFITLYEPFLKSFVESLRGGVASDAAEWDFNKLLDGWDKVFDKVVKKAEEGEAGVKVSPPLTSDTSFQAAS